MHNRFSRSLILISIITSLLAGCSGGATPTPSPVPPTVEVVIPTSPPTSTPTSLAEQPIYLAILWHQHQPVYYKDPATEIYSKPWVRLHAAKDYVDMAEMLKQYPGIHVTFNLTPSLLRQVDDLVAGAKDQYWVLTEIPAGQLSEADRQFILDRFFDTNRRIIERFPRYQELLSQRDHGDEFSEGDFRDLQVLFNLAWTDPDWLALEPLASLVAKGRDYSEADKTVVLDEHLRLLKRVVPVHKELQDAGQIEVTMTPFAHPILPLLVNTDLAKIAMQDVSLPSVRFAYGQDAAAQVSLGVELYEEHFGRKPRGMWPAEGSVSQEIVTMVAKNGIQWMASDEGVLANSLGFPSFTRGPDEVVTEPDVLYRPYYVEGRGGSTAIVFRDVVISDRVGFIYSGMPGELAAKDFIDRVHAIREALDQSGASGPHLVTVILDGENAWEYYENDGKEFLNTLYARLSEDPLIKTVTPSEYLALAPEQPSIENLWAGSWINHDFSTWIGEDEENLAWEYLAAAREILQKYIFGSRKVDAERLEQALTLMYIAEGSDWFWWYGADQDSGNDESFDQQFRDTLKQLYTTLGEIPPRELDVPIIPQTAVSVDRPASGLVTISVDGILSEGEWESAAHYAASGGVMAAAETIFSGVSYGFDKSMLYFNLDFDPQSESLSDGAIFEIYLRARGPGESNNFSRSGTLLGFPANQMIELQLESGNLASASLLRALGGEKWEAGQALELVQADQGVIELGVPLDVIGSPEGGDKINFRLIASAMAEVGGVPRSVDLDSIPGQGPGLVAVPDLGNVTMVLDVTDPEGDDHGPGTYTYPMDGVFSSGNFDILNFQVGYDDKNIVFKFAMRGPVDNAWDSPNGLSLQTFDIYIDVDGDGQGGMSMLPGRNLTFQPGYAWDFAITAEGWTPGIYVPTEEGPQQLAKASDFAILTDAGQRIITLRVPQTLLGDAPESWRYAAVVMSQEGYPSGGVMRVRDVLPTAEQWRIGGAPVGATNHTRVIDLVWSVAGEQESWLGDFSPVAVPQDQLTAEDYAKVPMFGVE